MVAYAVREDPLLGTRVTPHPVGPVLLELVADVQRVAWPVWLEPSARALRTLLELCRLQTARGLTVLSWLAAGNAPEDRSWLLATRRLAGSRQRKMYGTATGLPGPVRNLVVANWTWAVTSPHGGRVTAPYLASGAYETDGHAAAYASATLWQVWDRNPDVRPALAAAWAATRTTADWCKAAEMRVVHGIDAPVFTYPGGEPPAIAGVRPWITHLLLRGRRDEDAEREPVHHR
ncbi:MAG: hypothetical protein GEV03_21930 [Streptosporangiales bacterium]|nr:hypothetical protein [Streptosporangiales bacterium]